MEVRPDIKLANQDNLFNLYWPKAFTCQVFSYNISHSTMTICLTRHDNMNLPHESYTMVFDTVKYFSGNMIWHSADFHFSTVEQYLKVSNHSNALELDLSSIPSQLYCVNTNRGLVQIIASYAVMEPLAMWDR